jgi:hypothetical protein
VGKVAGFKNMALYGVYLTPKIVIYGEVKCGGCLPAKKDV